MSNRTSWRLALLERQRWIVFLAPFIVFMLGCSLEPTPDKAGGGAIGLAIPYTYYPWVYAVKIALTLATIAFVWPGYHVFAWRWSWTAVIVGTIGGPIWIGLSVLDLEHRLLQPMLGTIGMDWLIGSGVRSGFDPFAHLPPVAAWGFLAVRFFGLVAVVALIEEFFLRGFVMRFVMHRDWWAVPFGNADGMALVVGTIVPLLSHPEWIAALVWFSMITWLMLRTRNIWDCVIAHAITNFILGLYVVISGDWRWM